MKRLSISKHVALAILTVAFNAFLALASVDADTTELSDAVAIRTAIRNLNDFLDSQSYTEIASWDEHVVLTYRLAAGRDPNLIEFSQLRKLHERTGLSRSDALAIVLRGPEMRPSWQQCLTFVSRVNIADFRVDRSVRDKARQLAAAPEREVIQQIKSTTAGTFDFQLQKTPGLLAFEQYNIYFGYLHAHSTISDGEGSPRRAYERARDPGGLDFFALTDHGYAFNLWPWEDEWQQMKQAADDTYQPGVYATLWGFEWTSPVYGHINVLNSPDFTDFALEVTLHDIFTWIIGRPECFARFNHPGDYDQTGDEFAHLELYDRALYQMVGIENWNGNDGFDRHYYGGSWSTSEISYWDVGNLNGWYLGSLGGQDNHQEDWGIRNDFRTAVLAKELTRGGIIDAYMHRRFYATEDKDLHLDFRCEGYPMGSPLKNVRHIFEVKAQDGSGDTFREVRLYRNGEMIRTANVSGEEFHIIFEERSNNANLAYYYVIVQQNDDNDNNGRNDEAISSPIWIMPFEGFADVPPGYWAEDFIYAFFDAGITVGCSQVPFMYCPDYSVTRAEMAVFLERALNGGGFTPPTATGIFDDVGDSHWAADWIEQLYADGITVGCSQVPLWYCPENTVNRAEMAVFLLRTKYGSDYQPPNAVGIFEDVPTSHWASDWIEQLYREGITVGCSQMPFLFCPESPVTRAEMAVFMVRTFNL